MLYREHRGSLNESMLTVVAIEPTKDAVVEQIKKVFVGDSMPVNPQDVSVRWLCFDDRIEWDTYCVTLEGHGVLGFTNEPVDEQPTPDYILEPEAWEMIPASDMECRGFGMAPPKEEGTYTDEEGNIWRKKNAS